MTAKSFVRLRFFCWSITKNFWPFFLVTDEETTTQQPHGTLHPGGCNIFPLIFFSIKKNLILFLNSSFLCLCPTVFVSVLYMNWWNVYGSCVPVYTPQHLGSWFSINQPKLSQGITFQSSEWTICGGSWLYWCMSFRCREGQSVASRPSLCKNCLRTLSTWGQTLSFTSLNPGPISPV